MNTSVIFFFFNDTATTEIYTLSLHDALPISKIPCSGSCRCGRTPTTMLGRTREICARSMRWESAQFSWQADPRSEEHTSELQSQSNLVCRLLLEKKKKNKII